ncbi:hypothetical protein DYB34_008659 [Aphanomyces astaci]|uniref:Uncharacterized protein n=1 Tax=Aphanomyces astaci TaxID=112090 RepID=A0A3R6ZE81_APHAT|nr:hypothetical protein DYB34_008659 [Aphanomyces astaci]
MAQGYRIFREGFFREGMEYMVHPENICAAVDYIMSLTPAQRAEKAQNGQRRYLAQFQTFRTNMNAFRKQLLLDIDMISNKKKATKEDKCKKMDKRESDGHTVRSAALTGMKRKSLGDEGDDNDSDEAKNTMMKKERRSSAIMKESVNAVMSFTSIMENTNKFKIDELAFQKESNAIAMRKLELDEKRYLLDKAEREARFALEQQERQGQMDFMRGLLK